MSSNVALNTTTVREYSVVGQNTGTVGSESSETSRGRAQGLRNELLQPNSLSNNSNDTSSVSSSHDQMLDFINDMEKAQKMSFKAKEQAIIILADKLKEPVPELREDNIDGVLSYLVSLASSLTAKEREESGIKGEHTVGAMNLEMKTYAGITGDKTLMKSLLDEEHHADQADQAELAKYKRLEEKGLVLSANTDISKVSEADINNLDQNSNKADKFGTDSAKVSVQKLHH